MVNFLITEVDGQEEFRIPGTPDDVDTLRVGSNQPLQQTHGQITANQGFSPASSVTISASAPSPSKLGKPEAGLVLPMNSSYRVEDAELPLEAVMDTVSFAPASIPESIPMEKVMENIVQNLDFKSWSGSSRTAWFKDFKLPPSRAVMNDTFWFCICWYFKSGRHKEVEKRLFNRISANFVFLFEAIKSSRKDFFFRYYADGVAQAVLYAMFLEYPKSRANFTEGFRRDLVIRISYWTAGICPEFVDTSHWKLNLGGGDVLQATSSHAWRSSDGPLPASGSGSGAGGFGATVPLGGGVGGGGGGRGSAGGAGPFRIPFAAASSALATTPGRLSADALAGRRGSLAHRAPRPFQTLRYSPLMAHFLKTQKFSSINFVRPLRIGLTAAEERVKLMEVKHELLVQRTNASRKLCENASSNEQEERRGTQSLTFKSDAKLFGRKGGDSRTGPLRNAYQKVVSSFSNFGSAQSPNYQGIVATGS